MSRVLLVLRLGRPHFLGAGLLLYVLGGLLALLAGAQAHWRTFLLGYLVLLPAHLSVSYSNDYWDVETDRHGAPTPFAGGSGVLVAHPDLRPVARRLALGLMAASLGIALLYALLVSHDALLLAYAVLGNLVGWFYTAPPLRLAYRGVGELSTAATVGFLVPAMGYWVMRGRLDAGYLPMAAPLLLYGLGFILAVEIPDMEADRLGGKRTLVARRGRAAAFALLGGTLALAGVALALLTAWPPAGWPTVWPIAAGSLLPAGAGVWGAVRRPLEKAPATRVVNTVLLSFVGLVALADAYLAWALWQG